ncbi:hypothetical protein SBA3_1690014 [Candidatus Sulfopaludibacter sp. SbA3]|nr:hypothetical protein SBA3_1690014 [Candidatus Sulfopaludibacter sp. SbA3]
MNSRRRQRQRRRNHLSISPGRGGKHWSGWSKQKNANFSSLGPGWYQFRVWTTLAYTV